jgi:hypothetical protein
MSNCVSRNAGCTSSNRVVRQHKVSGMKKPDTGDPLHTQEPVTVASFRTWRDWRECVARDRCLTYLILTFRSYSSLSRWNDQQ